MTESCHVIVLTRDRPEVLCRCIKQLQLQPHDRLTVLDDSAPNNYEAVRTLLTQLSIHTRVTHLSAPRVFTQLRRGSPKRTLCWIQRTAQRDISPLRNLSLLVSACSSCEMTLLLDDDIAGLDIQEMRDRSTPVLRRCRGAIVGTHIAGIDEGSLVNRLSRALLAQLAAIPTDTEQIDHLFRLPKPALTSNPESVSHVSGGCLAFRIPLRSLIAFPAGYNEDWLWCLEMRRLGNAEVFQLPQIVLHEPPTMKELSEPDVMFELLGDLVFNLALQSMATSNGSHASRDDVCLSPPATVALDVDPHARVRTLVESACSPEGAGRIRAAGLDLLERMLTDGTIMIDWLTAVHAWQRDAATKRRAFDRTLSQSDAELRQLINQQVA